MKSSFYNIFIKANDQEYILFNTLTTGMIVLPSDISFSVMNNKINHLDRAIIQQLYNEGFIISETTSEIDILRYSYELDKYNNRVFAITIAPTMKCNLACSYCFEQNIQVENKILMSKDVQNAIIYYINSIIKSFDGIRVVWFGGEPLLGVDVINSLSKKIKEIAKKNSISYSASIITNGVQLAKKPELVKIFKKNSITDVQITLDGNEKEHNKRRKYRMSNKETFIEVIDAIHILKREGIHIGIRINVDMENYKSFNQLFKCLSENELLDLDINFGHLRNYGLEHNSIYASIKQFCDIQMEAFDLLKKYRKESEDYHYPTLAKPCVANRENTLVIDNQGYLYKCRTVIGEKKLSFGNIKDIKNNFSMFGIESAKWVGWSPFNYKKCKICKFLPLCLGGCEYNCFINRNTPECNEWSYYLNENLLKLYKSIE